MGLVLWLWSLQSNNNAYSTKDCLFLCIYLFWKGQEHFHHRCRWFSFFKFFFCIFPTVQNDIERFNITIENMAKFKCSWTMLPGSWQRFNLAIENMARFKCSWTPLSGSWQRFNLAFENMTLVKCSWTVLSGSW